MSAEHSIILYDGVCGLCNAFVRFLLRRDRRDRLRFAALQTDFGRAIVERHGGDPDALSTVYLVEGLGGEREHVRVRGKAALYSLDLLSGGWRLVAVLRFLPAPLLDLGYRLVARLRYRIWGRLDSCPVPSPEDRGKFLE